MSKKTTTKAKASKATKGAKPGPALQIKKDAKGRFWVVVLLFRARLGQDVNSAAAKFSD